jgi:hypothetical protein
MRKFVAKHAALTTGTPSCFDRLLFKGQLSLGYPHGMEDFLNHQGVLFKQLKPFVLRQASGSGRTPMPWRRRRAVPGSTLVPRAQGRARPRDRQPRRDH